MKRCIRCDKKEENNENRYCAYCGGILVEPELYDQIKQQQYEDEKDKKTIQNIVHINKNNSTSSIARIIAIIAEFGLIASVFLPTYKMEILGMTKEYTLKETIYPLAITIIIIAIISFLLTLSTGEISFLQTACGTIAIIITLVSIFLVYEEISNIISEQIGENLITESLTERIMESITQISSGGIIMLICSGLIFLTSFFIND